MTDRDRSSHPRTLIVGRGFDQSSGAGITLTSLFRGWPMERLAAAAAAEETRDTTVCNRYYVLGSEEAHWVWPLSRFAHNLPSGPVPRPANEANKTLPAQESLGRLPGDTTGMSIARRAFWGSVTASGAQHLLTQHRVSAGLARWIRSFRPEVVYTHLESLPFIGFVNEIITKFDLPLVIHMMDDWPSAPVGAGLLSPLIRREIDRGPSPAHGQGELHHGHQSLHV